MQQASEGDQKHRSVEPWPLNILANIFSSSEKISSEAEQWEQRKAELECYLCTPECFQAFAGYLVHKASVRRVPTMGSTLLQRLASSVTWTRDINRARYTTTSSYSEAGRVLAPQTLATHLDVARSSRFVSG